MHLRLQSLIKKARKRKACTKSTSEVLSSLQEELHQPSTSLQHLASKPLQAATNQQPVTSSMLQANLFQAIAREQSSDFN